MKIPRTSPTLEDIFGLIDRDQLSIVVFGHLVIESILTQLIELSLDRPDESDSIRLTSWQKASLCYAQGAIDKRLYSFLSDLNKLRNKFAHRLGFHLNFDQAFDLAKKAGKAGIDFSDDLDTNREIAASIGTDAVVCAVISNTAMHLSFVLLDNGGKFLFV